jgi:hypothetical protein
MSEIFEFEENWIDSHTISKFDIPVFWSE